MITKNQVLSYLKEYKQQHIKDYHIKKIGVFGSIVRGEKNPNDIDIVVEFSKPNLFIQAGIMEDLKEKFHINIDVIALSKYTDDKLLNRIEKEALYV